MGQYHLTVNLDKREFLDPHKLGQGLKLREQSYGGPGGVGAALIVLLAASNGRGGGDFDASTDPDGMIGRWAGDRLAIVGDYAEAGDLALEHRAERIYRDCGRGGRGFRDISDSVARVIEPANGVRFIGTGWRGVVDAGDVIHTPGPWTPGGYSAACGQPRGDGHNVAYQARYRELTCKACRTVFLRNARRRGAAERSAALK